MTPCWNWTAPCRSRSSASVRLFILVLAWVVASVIHNADSLVRGEDNTPALRRQVNRQQRDWKARPERPPGAVAGPDCNGNGVPDDQDIENCAGAAACDDCNLNGVLDECDIASFTSFDFDFNGVPDECIFYDNGGFGGYWSSAGNWFGDQIPNNLDLINDESVTIDTFGVNLDLKVEVDTLRLLDGASLTITGLVDEDLFVEEPGGILLTSAAAQQSRLLLGARQIMMTTSLLDVQSGGLFDLAPAPASAGNGAGGAVANVEAPLLVVANVHVSSKCGEPVPGEMNLGGSMVTHVYGSFVIDGSQDCVVCGFCNSASGSRSGVVAGGETPPIVRVMDSAKVRIGGSLVLLRGSRLVHTSSSPIEVSGDFINESICPQCFDMRGAIIFQPQGFAVAANVANPVQNIEVAGRDLGPTPLGFNTNFAFSTLEIAPSTVVNFVDNFPNAGTGSREALYVDTLILRSGAIVTLSDCRVYYNSLTINDGATIASTGNGGLVPVVAGGPIPAVSGWGLGLVAFGLAIAGSIVVARSRGPISTRRRKAHC
mgnify:CR=1 FL=1